MSALELDLINQILFINVILTSAINVQKLTIHIAPERNRLQQNDGQHPQAKNRSCYV